MTNLHLKIMTIIFVLLFAFTGCALYVRDDDGYYYHGHPHYYHHYHHGDRD